MDKTVEFYDPHPGLMGCPKPFPEHLRVTAEWLDGQKMTVDEAIQCFEDSAPEDEQPISVTAAQDCILIQMGSFKDKRYPVHCWRAMLHAQTWVIAFWI